MKHLPRFLLAALSLALTASLGAQSPGAQDRVAASFLLALGRKPTATETEAWNAEAAQPLAALLSRHRAKLQNDAEARRAVAMRAVADAFGRAPTAEELAASPAGPALYTELLQRHVASLAANPDAYREVIERAYRLVVNRAAYVEEFAYWKPYGTLPFTLLVGAIENWGQRNQPGLMVTNGVPSVSVSSRFLSTAWLSPAVANEARAVIGLPVWSDVARLKNPGCNVVAVGAADIASVGGVHFALAGGGPLAGR